MLIWHSLVSLLVTALWALAQIYGGNLGLAIITLSLVVRLGLLPLTLRVARRAQAQQETLRGLRADIAKLKARYRANPQQLASELSKLYREHGIRLPSSFSWVGNFFKFLMGAALYSAVKHGVGSGGRFLWIRNLARPDGILALLTGILTFVTSLLGAHLPEHSRFMMSLLPAMVTAFFAWHLASGVVLYWASSTAVGGLEALLLRRSTGRQP